MPAPGSSDGKPDHAPERAATSPIWPVGQRIVLIAAVVAAALGLAVASREVDSPPGDAIIAAPTLKLDPNKAPPQVLGALPQVGPTLVRQFVLARQDRPLTSLQDIRSRVRGVGPATLAQIAPYLRFESATGFELDQSARTQAGDRPTKKPRATGRKPPRSPTTAPTRDPAQLVARSTE
jgi:hypothetical protein